MTTTGCGSAVLFTASAIAGVPLDMSGVNQLMYAMDTKHTRGIENTFTGQKWLYYHDEARAFNLSFTDPQYKKALMITTYKDSGAARSAPLAVAMVIVVFTWLF